MTNVAPLFVEDPVTKIRFPKYLASPTLEGSGGTYYFVDEDTRREFEKQPQTKSEGRETSVDAIHKILVPTDFSAHADEAFRVAQTLARAVGAEVILFHVAQPPAVVSEGGRFLTDPATGKATNLWDRFHGGQPNDPKVRVQHEVIVVSRPGATQILETLNRLGADLIVMGTHGHSWLKQRLFGTWTEEVVRHAHCPVMVVKAPAHKAAPPHPYPSPSEGEG